MKTLFAFILITIMLFSSSSFGVASKVSDLPAATAIQNADLLLVAQGGTSKKITHEAATKNLYKVLRSKYIFATTKAAASTFEFDKTLPANVIPLWSYVRVSDTIVSANNNTISIDCGATSYWGANDFSAYTPDLIESSFFSPYLNSSSCIPTGTVGAGASGITAGAMELYIIYIEAY